LGENPKSGAKVTFFIAFLTFFQEKCLRDYFSCLNCRPLSIRHSLRRLVTGFIGINPFNFHWQIKNRFLSIELTGFDVSLVFLSDISKNTEKILKKY
jgi:hypothetical protein